MTGRTRGTGGPAPGDAAGGVDADLLDALDATLAYARERDYTGWDYGDGMSSRLLELVPGERTLVNLGVQEAVKRFPLNLRPLFLVEQRRNFMGAALFAMAEATAGDLADDPASERAARRLVEWLLAERVEGYAGFCVCHRHDLQTLDGVVPAGTPGVVGTAYAVKALLRADARFDADYAGPARSAADFVLEDLDYRPVDDGAVIDYKPTESGDHHTVNAVALGARLLLDLHARFGAPRLRRAAEQLLAYVAARQTDRGGWYYRDPPDSSHLSMDNHHNGFVIEAFQRHRAVTGDDRFAATLSDGLAFYREELFRADGAPNFDETSAYPRDVHASAQGILVFTYAGDRAFARRILRWTRENLGAGDGAFHAQRHRLYTRRHVLMRWCQAWMAYAMAELARAPDGAAEPFDA